MTRLCTVVGCLAILLLGPRAMAVDWALLVPGFDLHVPRVEVMRGEARRVCSAVVFEVEGGVVSALTAAHCVEHDPGEHLDITANGQVATLLPVSHLLDLAIIQFKAKYEVPIVFARSAPPAGTEIAILGYGFGSPTMVTQFGRVARLLHHELWLNADVIYGDSGGAVVDGLGRLIGINISVISSGPSHLAVAIPVDIVIDFVDDFRQQRKRKK